MKFRIGKAEVRLSIGVLPLFAALIVAGEGRALAVSALSLLLHELSHLIAAKNLGFSVRRVGLYPFGAVLHLDPCCAKTQSEWIVALSGPVASLVIASCGRMLAHLLPSLASGTETFIRANAAIALLNLLPAYPLDGGRVAKALLCRATGERTARRITFAFTAAVAAMLAGLGIYCLQKGTLVFTPFLIAPFLLASAWIEWKRVPPSVIETVLERQSARRAGAPVAVQTVLLDGSATVGEAMRQLSHRRFTVFRIKADGRTLEADEDALLDAASRCGYAALLKDVFCD